MHWADSFVKNLSGEQLFSTGISPSGPIHVGNMREILTGDILFKAAVDSGLKSRFIYLCDDIDPLRKVYPFLPETYADYVGHPLSMIPSPDGEGTYSEHYLKPFLDTLEKINVKVEVVRTTDLYDSGVFAETIDIVINNRDRVAKILEEVSGRSVGEEWYPYNPLCESCGRITKARITSYEYPKVSYSCECGHEGVSDIRKAQGKMPWRVEWPAKWHALGVTVEPFGKDHGARGGSYDSGKRIVEEIFGTDAPAPLIYERILLKGKGAMHSSSGVVVEASEMIRFAPPQILRFLIARSQPGRHITFDPEAGLLNLIDEYERYEKAYVRNEDMEDDTRRVYEFSRLSESTEEISQIGFRHLVTLVQIYPNEEDLLEVLKRSSDSITGITPVLEENISAIMTWLENYAPENVKFTLLDLHQKVELTEKEKSVVMSFLTAMEDLEWSADSIHNRIHQIIKDSGMKPQEGFASFYKVLIGAQRGPRLGYFLSTLGKEYARDRISFACGV